jgi:hypothetical protein
MTSRNVGPASARLNALIDRLNMLALASTEADVAWEGPCPPDTIAAVEDALGVQIVGSFRDFLLKTGGGGLDMFSISAVPTAQPLGGLGTVHGDTLHYRQNFWASPLPPHLLVIQRDQDDNEPFCLDTSRTVAGENPVVLFYPSTRNGHTDRIAASFIDFLEEYLAPYFEELPGGESP